MPSQSPAEADINNILKQTGGTITVEGRELTVITPDTLTALAAYAATVEREADRKARIDELKKITKNTFDKPATPENQNDQTWQGGYRFAKNSLKRYKLARLAALQGPPDGSDSLSEPEKQ